MTRANLPRRRADFADEYNKATVRHQRAEQSRHLPTPYCVLVRWAHGLPGPNAKRGAILPTQRNQQTRKGKMQVRTPILPQPPGFLGYFLA